MKVVVAFFGVFLFFFAPSLSAQTIYKWKDEKGQWHFSQTPPAGGQKIERRELPMPLPYEIPQDEPCAPFKAGETRKPKAARPSVETPYLQIVGSEVRLLEAGKSSSKFSWKMRARNTAPQSETVQGVLTLLNCELFPIAIDKSELATIPGGSEITLSGTKTIVGDLASNVGRFNIGLGHLEKTATEPTEKNLPYSKPRVAVIATNLYRASDSNIYFSGEVYNAGSAVARNVKVSFTIKNENGNVVDRGTVSVEPSDLKPGGSAIFQKRIPGITQPPGHSWFTEVEHSQ